MSDRYTVLPSANAVLCASVKGGIINISLNGTNTRAAMVGAVANSNDVLLLVKFRVGGFFSFYGFDQDELTDKPLDLYCLDKSLAFEIIHILTGSQKIDDIATALDRFFIFRLQNIGNAYITAMTKIIIERNGNITARQLGAEFHYSEKHIRRLFLRHVGVSPKKFSRIVRVNYTLRLMQGKFENFTNVSEEAGFFDQAHLIHDFKDLFNITPCEYTMKMSDFYNAESI
jgi:AraC-like DNA-binding protein